MLLTSLQSKKVDEIVNHFNGGRRLVDFKAPTGSGKTLMATAVISRLINTNPNEKLLFIIATISSSDLPEQFERKINEYKDDLEFTDFSVEYIKSPSQDKKTPKDMQIQIRPEQNKVYLFGKASFGAKRIITEQGVINTFIQEAKQQGFKICYIRDEAHIGTRLNHNDTQNFENLMNQSANYRLRMTATLDSREVQVEKVELTETDLNNPELNDGKYLIKTKCERLMACPANDLDILRETTDFLNQAITKFRLIQQEYRTLNVNIRPAMLIQVDNEPSDLDQKDAYFKVLNAIKEELMQRGLSWVQYFGDDNKDSSHGDNINFTLNKITRNDDTTDCILFKIGPATGWDIPRACMLLQIRHVCSQNLNIQTIGRIKRNPYPGLEKNSITDKYYLYSNNINETNEDFSVYEYQVKGKFKGENFISIEIQKDKDLFDKNKIADKVKEFLKKKYPDIRSRINISFHDGKYENQQKGTRIISPILLLKQLKIMEYSLTSYQKDVLLKIRDEYKNTELRDVKFETLKIVLLDYFMTDIKNIVQTCIDSDIKYELKERVIKPTEYTEITSQQDEDMQLQHYLFDIKKNGNSNASQFLDSKNERVIFRKIIDFLSDEPDAIKVWAKNQTTSNIYGEYLDENNYIKHSFFDFILKYNNGVSLYIEVKGEPDINAAKTDLLRKAYQKYFQDRKDDLFSKNIIICIAKVSAQELISTEIFCDKNLSFLPNGKFIANGITFNNLLRYAGLIR